MEDGHLAGNPQCPWYQMAGEQYSAERRAIADLYENADHFLSSNLTPKPTPLNITYFSSPATSPSLLPNLRPTSQPSPPDSWAQRVTSPAQRIAKIKKAAQRHPEPWMTGSNVEARVAFLEKQIEEIRDLVGVRGRDQAVEPPPSAWNKFLTRPQNRNALV